MFNFHPGSNCFKLTGIQRYNISSLSVKFDSSKRDYFSTPGRVLLTSNVNFVNLAPKWFCGVNSDISSGKLRTTMHIESVSEANVHEVRVSVSYLRAPARHWSRSLGFVRPVRKKKTSEVQNTPD